MLKGAMLYKNHEGMYLGFVGKVEAVEVLRDSMTSLEWDMDMILQQLIGSYNLDITG